MKSFSIGGNESEMLKLTVVSYALPQSGEFYDDNWLQCKVSVHAGAFRGTFHASFLTCEIEELRQGLSKLYRELNGRYKFEPMEGQLTLHVSCDKLGHFHFSGEAMDQVGIGQKLTFGFSLDQTYLSATLEKLSDMAHAFPVRK